VNKCTPEEYAPLVHNTIEFLKGRNTDIIQNLYNEMDQASEALEFEKAASLLRTIRQLEHVAETQPLVSTDNCDAFGCWSQGSELFIIQLLFRSGKLIGSNPYSFSGTLEEEGTALTSFLLQHYRETFPDEILLPFPLDEAPLLAEILTERRGKPCLVSYPKKGGKQQMRELAQNNAKTLFYQNQTQEILREKTLSDLQITLKLERYPARIACFDTSHIAGSDPVASLVIFSDGIKNNKEGRLFNIKKASDDYGALREVLTRYLERTESLPDLIIVDGGKGQLHAALTILHELSIASVDLIALTKEEGRHDKGMTAERVFLPSHADPIHLNPRSHLLFFLQTIRDEAHRKALSFHQKRRAKRHLTSALDALPGIGPVKKQRLLKHFGSVANIKRASLEELQQVPGLTAKDLLTLQKHLR
jgi:excinuclease ABC subunit C